MTPIAIQIHYAFTVAPQFFILNLTDKQFENWKNAGNRKRIKIVEGYLGDRCRNSYISEVPWINLEILTENEKGGLLNFLETYSGSQEIKKNNKEIFYAAKKLLKDQGERSCVFTREDHFKAMLYGNTWDDGMIECDCHGVRLCKGGLDPYDGLRSLEFNITSDKVEEVWFDAELFDPQCFADMYEFVKKNIDCAMIPTEDEPEEDEPEEDEPEEDDDEW